MRYFVAYLMTIGLLIVLIFVLFTRGGDGPKKVPTKRTLASYATTSAEASLTIDGPINANSLHRQVRILVNNNDVEFNVIQGYGGNVIKIQSFANSNNAYSTFLSALARAGFTRGTVDSKHGNSAGACPLGKRYTYNFKDDKGKNYSYWSTSCGGSLGNYLGNPALTINLFKAQVPDYAGLTSDLYL